jgi:hypothetical protein
MVCAPDTPIIPIMVMSMAHGVAFLRNMIFSFGFLEYRQWLSIVDSIPKEWLD